MSEFLENIIKNIPEKPGCYQFLDWQDTVIYVGKAKNLKKRVSSYFNKNHDNTKTSVLVSKIRNIQYIVVNTEEDTLLLENNLIKELQPRYNILLKDDKTYPSIVIKNEMFPRVMQTREIVNDRSLYFGPYTSTTALKTLLETIYKAYPIRSCNLNLSPENIAEGKYKVCLDYHIKRCSGPCEGFQTRDDYNKNIEEIKKILKGDTQIVSQAIYDEMLEKSANNEFEAANDLKHKYLTIEGFKNKSTVVSSINYNIDVFAYEEDDKVSYINYLNLYNGAIIQAYTFEFRKRLEEDKETMLGIAIVEMRSRFGSQAKEVVVPFLPDIEMTGVEFIIPQRGDKVKLQKLSEKNVKQYKLDKLKRAESLNPEQRVTRILKTLEKDLKMKELPNHIECFDNSNIQGTDAVSACVVFKRGKPSKKDYRIFNVKTVEGSDDYSTMREVLTRRYSRLKDEELALPQLIVIDGGKGQLGIAQDVLKELGLYGKIALISIAEKLEEIYYPDDPVPLYLDKNSDSLKIIQFLRDEAHRFGIKHHRNKRSKTQIKSELDNIKGIGPETKKDLLRHFKSIKRIKESKDDDLIALVGQHKAILIRSYFEQNSN